MNELRTIPRFPNYSITKDGRVWSESRKSLRGHEPGRWLTNTVQSNGYAYTHFNMNGIQRHFRLANLMLSTFVGPCPDGMQCRHLDGDKKNNHLSNLRWGTPKENQQDSIRHGTHCSLRRGDESNRAILCENQVRLIFNAYHDGAYTIQELADYFGVKWTTIYHIILKKSWGHLWAN